MVAGSPERSLMVGAPAVAAVVRWSWARLDRATKVTVAMTLALKDMVTMELKDAVASWDVAPVSVRVVRVVRLGLMAEM